MSKIPIYVGIDSGGTKTLAMTSTQTGEVISTYRTVGANPYDIGWEGCYEIFSECINALSSEEAEVQKICISGAGIGTISAEISNNLSNALSVQPSQLVVIGDAYAAHLGAFAGNDGILVVAGTGTNMIARKQNEFIRVGGWGHILGDQCSGYGIALDAIKQSVLDNDLQVESDLLREVKRFYSIDSNSELLLKLQDAPKSLVAGFVKEVLALAEAGDARCVTIINQHFAVFRQQLSYLKGFLELPKVSVVGGLFENSYYWRMFEGGLEPLNIEFQEAIFTPVEAATQIALGQIDVPVLPT